MSNASHIVSMQTLTVGQEFLAVAVCECGWRHTVAWGFHAEVQDQAIEAHWREVGFKPEISE